MTKTLFGNKPLAPRDPEEAHRAATPLELFFDLVSVIAIAAAASSLHHAIAENHVLEGVIKYVIAMFGIWWAWMNYTWFASSYDNDDAVFRIFTMINMAGALVMAAGITPFFESLDLTLIVIGFVIMRLSLVAQWVRVALQVPAHRPTASRYAIGIAVVQVLWILLMLVQHSVPQAVFLVLMGLGACLEMLVPTLVERRGPTSWHRHHIVERYGLLTIIVLGETLLACILALGGAAEGHFEVSHLMLFLYSLTIVFCMWWLYFSKEEHLHEQRMDLAFTWGYGHILIYASGTAVGAGLAAMIDIIGGHAKISELTGSYIVAIAVAVYLIGLWFVRDRFVLSGSLKHVLLIFAVLVVLAVPLSGLAGVTALCVLCVMVRSFASGNRGVHVSD